MNMSNDNKPTPGKYKVHSAYSQDEKPINIEVDDKGVVVACDKAGGGKTGVDWIKQYTNPYTESDTPWFQVFEYAIAGSYLITGPYNDAGENMAEAEIAKDEEMALMEISKTEPDKRLVFGWAYTTHDKDGNLVIDKSGEYVDDPDELEKAAYNFVIKSRVQGDMHKRTMANGELPVGTMVESMVFTPEKIAKMGLPPGSLPTGWWTGFRVDDDEAWEAVKSGKRKSFSIHGKAVRKEQAP
jgi:hypothetical protein